MAANICMRNSFELFTLSTSPGTSDIDISGGGSSFWKDEPPHESKYLCLDSPVSAAEQQRQLQPMAICAGCRLEICDRFFLRVNPNLEYHAHCLKCFQCSRPLDENQTAFVKNGQTYCRDDYRSLFSTRCARCHGEFEKSDLVMRAGLRHVFHLACFSCVSCEKRLQTGDEFQIKNNNLLCRSDCHQTLLMDTSDGPSSLPDFSKINDNNNSSSNFDEDEWEDEEERSTLTSLDNNTSSPMGSPKSDNGTHTPLFGHSGSGGSSSSYGKKKKDKQATRVRTVLNESQLKTLKDCYSVNSRPDASLKEKLVELTGLNARVIRVWFQNKRCKDKKRQIQITENRLNSEREEVMNRVRINGIGPLMVQPATPHIDTIGGGGPIEIQHFAQWGPSGTTPPGAPQQYGNAMMFNSPVEIPPFGVTPIMAPVAPTVIVALGPSSDPIGPLGASVFPHYSPQHASLTASSHGLGSSPSGSE